MSATAQLGKKINSYTMFAANIDDKIYIMPKYYDDSMTQEENCRHAYNCICDNENEMEKISDTQNVYLHRKASNFCMKELRNAPYDIELTKNYGIFGKLNYDTCVIGNWDTPLSTNKKLVKKEEMEYLYGFYFTKDFLNYGIKSPKKKKCPHIYKKCCSNSNPTNTKTIIKKCGTESRLYNRKSLHAEFYIKNFLSTMDERESPISDKVINNFIDTVKYKYGNGIRKEVPLTPSQKQAIKEIFANKHTIIHGGPGSGKSTLLIYVIDLIKTHSEMSYLILSFTHKAIENLVVKCKEFKIFNGDHENLNTQTIAKFRMETKWRSNYDIIFVDETSMVDSVAMAEILYKCKDSRLCFIGDYLQIPPIEKGNPFKDIIMNADKFNGVEILEIEGNHRAAVDPKFTHANGQSVSSSSSSQPNIIDKIEEHQNKFKELQQILRAILQFPNTRETTNFHQYYSDIIKQENIASVVGRYCTMSDNSKVIITHINKDVNEINFQIANRQGHIEIVNKGPITCMQTHRGTVSSNINKGDEILFIDDYDDKDNNFKIKSGSRGFIKTIKNNGAKNYKNYKMIITLYKKEDDDDDDDVDIDDDDDEKYIKIPRNQIKDVVRIYRYKQGAKIVFCKNDNKNKQYFNGDDGTIEFIDETHYHIKNATRNTIVKIEKNRAVPFMLGYCMTVHKAQGSEWENVIVYMGNSTADLHILYTAITRVKSKLLIVEKERGLFENVCKRRINPRLTFLSE